METTHINVENFKKRLVDLCLRSGLSEFPTKRRDQQILLKSIANSFMTDRNYSETEVNGLIKQWLFGMSDYFPAWDHVTLRRRLVDEDFLRRDQDGARYRLNPAAPAGIVFESAVDDLDIVTVLEEGQNQIAQRKAEYLQRRVAEN